MQSLWYLFSKDPRDGLGAFGWPAFNSDSETLALQGRDNRPVLELVEPSEYDWPCGDIVMGGETQH
jgi:cholinesterase